jgi:hypothetical protein
VTRTYWPLTERRRDRSVVRIIGYSDTRIMPPDLVAPEGHDIVIGAPVQLLPPTG